MVERIRTKVRGQFEPSAFGVEILDLLRVPSDDSASERTFYLVAKILDKDIQEVDMLLIAVGSRLAPVPPHRSPHAR